MDKLVGFSILVGIFQDCDPVGTFSGGSREGILKRLSDLHSAFGVKSEIDWFADIGFGGV